MYGSKKVIVERFREEALAKLAKQYLIENGYSNVYRIIKPHKTDPQYKAEKGAEKFIIRCEHKTSLVTLEDLKTAIEFKEYYRFESVIIITNQEYTSNAKTFADELNILLIGLDEIDDWVNSKFITCNEFVEYVELMNIQRDGGYSARELIDKYQELKVTLGRQPGMLDMGKYAGIKFPKYLHKWGTWRNFIASVGDKPFLKFVRGNISQSASVTDLIEDYLLIRKRINDTPKIKDIIEFSKFTEEQYSFFFGSWLNLSMLIEKEIDNALK